MGERDLTERQARRLLAERATIALGLHAWIALVVFVAAAIVVLAWVACWPASRQRCVSAPLWRHAKRGEIRDGWAEVMTAYDLTGARTEEGAGARS